MSIVALAKANCSGCSACYSACPYGCISMAADDQGFLYPVIDSTICKDCDICSKVCNATSNENKKRKYIKLYGLNSKTYMDRKLSSSGGAFPLLANEIISSGGVVFGAAFNKNWEVNHVFVDTIKNIDKIRVSKYVQSNIGDTYLEAKNYLKDGVLVYFSGTPCQIAGLKSFLGKEYENLITQDIICHGVPSPMIWRDYLDKKFEKNRINKISFRDKSISWSHFGLLVEHSGKRFFEDLEDNAYLLGFLKNLYLRPSCHQCRFKGENRFSDITLADFWGCNKIAPELYDEKGSSLVFVNTVKGNKYVSKILCKTKYLEINDERIFDYNSAAVRSVLPNKNRELFFKKYDKNNIEKLILNCLGDSSFKKNIRVIKKKIRFILSRIKRCVLRNEKSDSI